MMNYTKDLRSKTDSSQIFQDTNKEWTIPHSSDEVNIIQIPKQAKTIQEENIYRLIFFMKICIQFL